MTSENSVQQSTSVNEFARGWAVLFAAFVGIGVSLTSMVYYATGIWVRPMAGRVWLDARRDRCPAIYFRSGPDVVGDICRSPD